MPYKFVETSGVPIKAWIEGVPCEDAAQEQLENVAGLPFIHKHVAVMPDVHFGMGATVGSVIATKGAVIPAAVGVDIGCGMCALRTDLDSHDLPDNLKELRGLIEATIPVGFEVNKDMESGAGLAWTNLAPKYAKLSDQFPEIVTKKHPSYQLGSLGGGNHFIEVCLDENDRVWTMLHSGSRGIGNRIGNHFISLAKKEMERWFIHLPDKNLAYLVEGSENYENYVEAVGWAQEFARLNRMVMLDRVIANMKAVFRDFFTDNEAVNCHHNYIARENHFGSNVWVTRKGAVRARKNDLGIIPGSMGARSYIVEGKENADSFHSCSHGAGRAMSRTEANRRFTVEDHIKATEGVECRKDKGVIDETPMAYKDIDAVMAAQADLVNVRHTLRQILCVKG